MNCGVEIFWLRRYDIKILKIILWNLRLPCAQTIIMPNAFTMTCTYEKIAADDLIHSRNFTGISENLQQCS